ncbi:MAG TPA: hypothetical protein VK849_14650, partial [Longimicrobiales bacterium]|nr:hypothetical protein [Longimicrobiales bacterium]
SDPELQRRLLTAVRDAAPSGAGHVAGVVGPDGAVITAAVDERAAHGDNPTWSGPMRAMGGAGSSVNLHECVLVFCAADPAEPLDAEAFGHSSQGACELFAPGVLLVDARVGAELRALLEKSGVRVVEAPSG